MQRHRLRFLPPTLIALMLSITALLAHIHLSASGLEPPRDQSIAAAQRQGGHRFGRPEPLDRPSGTIRIATYNILNLFDNVDDPKLQGEHDDIKMVTPYPRAKALAEAIREMDADILALQEVESLECLRAFRDEFLKDMGYDHLASHDVGYYRGIEQSVMSRFPLRNVRIWPNASLNDVKREGPGWAPAPRGESLTFQRSPLAVDVRAPGGYEFTLFIVHHKAGGKKFNHAREVEALKIVELIESIERRDPSRNVIVLGDFNAAPWDKSFRVYLEAGMIDALAHRTTWRDHAETPLFKTHESDRVLDYILMNSAARREMVDGSAHVFGTLTPPSSYDWRTDEPPPGYASDHYPVIVDIHPKDMK